MKEEITKDNRKLFKFDISTSKSNLLLTFLETRDPEKNIGFTVNFGVKCIKSSCSHDFGNMDISTKTNNHEFYSIMTVVFNKIGDFLKDNPKYSFISYNAKHSTLKEFYQKMATKRWPHITVKENKNTNEIYIYRDGVKWKGEVFKSIEIDTKTNKEIPQEPFDYFEFPSRFKIRKPKR